MKRLRRDLLLVAGVHGLTLLTITLSGCAPAQQWIGTINDSYCGASGHLWDEHGPPESPRDCALRCIRDGAQYVLVSEGSVYPIENQDAQGLEDHAGVPVAVSGTMQDGTITVRTVEPLVVPAQDSPPVADDPMTEG